PVRAVDTRRTFAGREQTGDRGHLRVGVHRNAAHDVVRGRTHLHRLLRDVDVGELLELVVHARELALDVLLGVRELRSDPRDVEEDTAVRAAPSLAHLAPNGAGDVVAR